MQGLGQVGEAEFLVKSGQAFRCTGDEHAPAPSGPAGFLSERHHGIDGSALRFDLVAQIGKGAAH